MPLNSAVSARLLTRGASAAAVLAVLVSTQSCSKEQPSPDPASGSLKQSVATQKRLNRYFHDTVVPKIETCWKNIQGKGTIEMKYFYAKDGKGGWEFQKLDVGESSLPEGQDAVALACMQGAVSNTSFPEEAGDDQESYFISWHWPVPFPVDAAEQVEAMFLDNGGGEDPGCDGNGAPASCWNCTGGGPGKPLKCLKVCVGYQECSIVHDQYPLPHCKAKTKCASGGPFGVVGGTFIF